MATSKSSGKATRAAAGHSSAADARGEADVASAPGGVGADAVASDAAPPSVEQVLAALEAVVVELERGDLPLERALARFEAGVGLARAGAALLDRVEQRVEQLLGDGRRAAFAGEGGAGPDERDDAD